MSGEGLAAASLRPRRCVPRRWRFPSFLAGSSSAPLPPRAAVCLVAGASLGTDVESDEGVQLLNGE